MSSPVNAQGNNHIPSLRLAALAIGILTFAAWAGTAEAAQPGNLPSNVQLQQWETKPQGGWITGALNANNSDYMEGEVVPFRLEIPSSIVAGSYQFSVCRNYKDGVLRGYLYHAPFNTDRPAEPGGAISSSSDGFAAVNAALDSVVDAGGQGACKSGDREATVVITKQDGVAYVLWGGHLASPDDAGVGPGNSASYWPGGSLHMKLLSPSKDVAIQTCSGAATPTSALTATTTTTATASVSATATPTISVTMTPTPSSTPASPSTGTPTPTQAITTTATSTATPTSTSTLQPNTSTPTQAAATASPTATAPLRPTNTPAATPTAPEASTTPATATPTRISEQAGAATRPRMLPAAGNCGASSGGSGPLIPLLLSGMVLVAVGAGFWILRLKRASLPMRHP